ncbi:MAG: glutathione binding-like protein, partial [Xanthobacteraceae bacterium]
LPYQEHFVDVWKSEQYNPDFIKLNPNSKIPVIVDHDGPGGKPYTVFESGAILIYLAEKTGHFFPQDPVKRYDALQWLMIQLTGIGPMFGQRVHFRRFAPAGNDYGVTRYGTEVQRLYDLIEKRLATRPYICGDEYTIVDIATFPWLRNHVLLDIDISGRPNVKRYIDIIAERPAVKAALAKVAAIKSNRDTANDDQKDRFFNRGRYARA